MAHQEYSRNRVLVAIAIFRFAKGALLAFVGITAFRLVDSSAAARARTWLEALPFATEHGLIRQVIVKIFSASRASKELAAMVAFGYATLFVVEGIGLWLEKLWAEYLTIVATASFIPFEIYEVVQHSSIVRIAVLVSNIVIVGYLVRHVRQARRRLTA
jgi:uncharacterized membrane protein (DUF2068 family)